MTTFNREELLRIAHLSGLPLDEKEMALFTQQINAILDYVNQLRDVPAAHNTFGTRTINVFREDKALQKETAAILEQAPEVDEGYFVVPKILDEK